MTETEAAIERVYSDIRAGALSDNAPLREDVESCLEDLRICRAANRMINRRLAKAEETRSAY